MDAHLSLASWHSYPSIYNLGHRYVSELFLDPVVVQEKIDGSQFSFGYFDEGGFLTLRCRSKGAQINVDAPDKMFAKAVEAVKAVTHRMRVNWTYRAEYLQKPKHNALAYDRTPMNHLILFDICVGEEIYLPHEAVALEAATLGFDVVPKLFEGKIENVEIFRTLIETMSCLGGQKVEGVVIKNYARFGLDKKVLMGKFVSEAFKETHAREWKAANPGQGDVILKLAESLKTDARWHKAVIHLRESGRLEDSPRDIGFLLREVQLDIEKEEVDFIKQKLYDWAWPQLRRMVVGGLPEWYKQQLLAKQFPDVEGL